MSDEHKSADIVRELHRLERKIDEVRQRGKRKAVTSHNVKVEAPEGTLTPPVVEAVEFKTTNTKHLKHLSTISPPVVKAATTREAVVQKASPRAESQKPATDKEPWEGYSKMTVGEVLKKAKDVTPEQRKAAIAYERSHSKRETVIQPLVNWNN